MGKVKYVQAIPTKSDATSEIALPRRRPKRCVWISSVFIICVGLACNGLFRSEAVSLPFDLGQFLPEDPSDYSRALKYINETRDMLVEYYGGDDSAMLGAFGSPQYLDKLRDILTDKFTHSLINRKKLVFGMIGSSVMAGHDNCHYDSYTEQLYRMLKPIFKDIEFGVEVNNAGIQGTCGDSFVNRVWCMEHLVGDADTVHAVWHFFGWQNNPKSMESYIRWALISGIIPTRLHLGGGNGGLMQNYGDLGYQTFDISHYVKKNGASTQWGHMGDGLHNTTRYGELPGVTPERRNSLAVNFRNWHPGPLTFQFDSDAFFYLYSEAIYGALTRVQAMSSEEKRNFPKPHYELPDPIYLTEEDLDFSKTAPSCRVGEDPAFGVSSIEVKGGERYYGHFEYKIPGPEQVFPECKHIDRCGGWKVPEEGLIASMPKLENGIILLCGIQQPENIYINNELARINASEHSFGCAKVEDIPQAAFEAKFELKIVGGGRIHDFISL